MKTLHTKRIFGFTIIELMIVLVIVAILLAVAYPSYIKYARKAKRGEAQQILLNWSINQEIWRSNNTSYANTTDLPVPTNDYYTLDTVGDPNATTYVLQATALGDQLNDNSRGVTCSPMTLNQAGVKTPAECWE